MVSDSPSQLHIREVLEPTYGGHASIFATTFVKEERPIKLHPLERDASGTLKTSGFLLQTMDDKGHAEQNMA